MLRDHCGLGFLDISQLPVHFLHERFVVAQHCLKDEPSSPEGHLSRPKTVRAIMGTRKTRVLVGDTINNAKTTSCIGMRTEKDEALPLRA